MRRAASTASSTTSPPSRPAPSSGSRRYLDDVRHNTDAGRRESGTDSHEVGEGAMLKKILIALVAIIALFLIVVVLQPSEFSVERTATMAAPPATVFEQVNDFHKWEAWSPWRSSIPTPRSHSRGRRQAPAPS